MLSKEGHNVDVDKLNVNTDDVYDGAILNVLRSKIHHAQGKERSALNVFLTAHSHFGLFDSHDRIAEMHRLEKLDKEKLR